MDLFATQGYAATSMTDIADAAGLSRPTLYQHFANREDLFRAGLQDMLERANEQALAALVGDAPLVDRFDGYLQRCRGDVIGPLLASRHGAELLETRLTAAADVADELHRERRRALERVLRDVCPDQSQANRAADLLELSPLGFKHDQPSIALYRKRLRALAEATAELVEATAK